MVDKNDVIKELEIAKHFLCNPHLLNVDVCIKIGQAISDGIALLKNQEANSDLNTNPFKIEETM